MSELIEKREVIISNKLGLHARASAKLVGVASRFTCDIILKKGEDTANAKSIMDVLILAASQNTLIEMTTTGEDAVAALDALEALINDKFGEGE
jgi:phosphocarrier protein HPr